MDYEYWCSLSDDELAQRDISELNLVCSNGLPGSGGLRRFVFNETLDCWTNKVRLGTDNALRNRGKFPQYDDLSEAEYRILTMYSVFYRHLGLTLGLHSHDTEQFHDPGESRISFIPAVIQDGYPATCATAPVPIPLSIRHKRAQRILAQKSNRTSSSFDNHLGTRTKRCDGFQGNGNGTDSKCRKVMRKTFVEAESHLREIGELNRFWVFRTEFIQPGNIHFLDQAGRDMILMVEDDSLLNQCVQFLEANNCPVFGDINSSDIYASKLASNLGNSE